MLCAPTLIKGRSPNSRPSPPLGWTTLNKPVKILAVGKYQTYRRRFIPLPVIEVISPNIAVVTNI